MVASFTLIRLTSESNFRYVHHHHSICEGRAESEQREEESHWQSVRSKCCQYAVAREQRGEMAAEHSAMARERNRARA
jgi:hypothetical protein